MLASVCCHRAEPIFSTGKVCSAIMNDNSKFLEEKLREAACFGDLDIVQELLSSGVNVNSQNSVNGWSALHWAAHRNYNNIVEVLLKHGADRKCLTNDSKSPYDLTTSREIQILLEGKSRSVEEKSLPIIPGYMHNPPLYVPKNFVPAVKNYASTNEGKKLDSPTSGLNDEELVLKLRLANSGESDFIEVEIAKCDLSFKKLVETCCEELNISSTSISKIRKLPNTIVRKDKDVFRLKNFQEIEVVQGRTVIESNTSVSSANSMSQSVVSNKNQYESISLKKDQTVLY